MQTINEAVEYLVRQGKPANMARAAITEYCAGEVEGMLCPDVFEEPRGATKMTQEQVTQCYTSFETDATLTEQGIEFDGELLFDLNGNYL